MSEKRKKIVTTALKLFCENGFQNTSTALISREAEVATGTLFLYFPVKEELIISLYIESKNELIQFLKEGLSRQKTPKLKIKHLWDSANKWALENPVAFRYIQLFSTSSYSGSIAKRKTASMSDIADKFLSAAIAEGSIVKISTPLFFAIFEGIWTSTFNHVITLKSTKTRQSALDQSFELFWKGLSK